MKLAPTRTTIIALLALLACSACASQSRTTTAYVPTAYQYTAVQWEQATAASTAASVTNNNLIGMR